MTETSNPVSMFSLLSSRRFLPLFIVQFLGAFNDNLLKTVLVVLIAYGLWDIGGWDAGVLVAVAAGLFILPFALFTPLAGNLSDKYDKAKMIRIIKLAEIVIAVLAIWALFSGSLEFAFVILLMLGVQSAFFSPIKFSILPQHLEKRELIIGNGWISTGTYLAILGGTIVGAALALMDNGKLYTAGVLMVAAIVGYIAARFVPEATPPEPNLGISFNIVKKAYGVIRFAYQQPAGVFVAILGTAWFYFIAAAFHSQFPNFTSQALGADNGVLIAFMVIFSVGIALGGLLNHKVLGGKTDGRFVPIACVLMGVFGVDIFFAAKAYPVSSEALVPFTDFVGHIHGVRLLMDTLLQAVACGFFVVPLRAIVQARTSEAVRSRVISSSNMMEALFILSSSVLATVVLAQGLSVEGLYLIVSVLTILVGLMLFGVKSIRNVGSV